MIPSASEWKARPRRIVGLMSGTSLDGIDAALVEVNGFFPDYRIRLLDFLTLPYSTEERRRISVLFEKWISLPELVKANVWLGEMFAAAALQVIIQAGLTPAQVDAIASHGQTVWHTPPEGGKPGATLQIGEPCVIAERTGILTVADFRPRDMAAGGQGAPLVPFADYLLFHHQQRTVAVLNCGGIANLTCLPRGCQPEQVIAFDTGPGNMIIDGIVSRVSQGGETYDRDGQRAARGVVRQQVLDVWLQHPYFQHPPPKSTGREMFGSEYISTLWHEYLSPGNSPDDLIATATAFTAESIVRAVRDFLIPSVGRIDEVVMGGGGSHNPVLRAMLAERLSGITLSVHEDHGISSDAKEAIAFALLGHAAICGVTANLPSATGAVHPVVLGKIIP